MSRNCRWSAGNPQVKDRLRVERAVPRPDPAIQLILAGRLRGNSQVFS